MEDLSFKIIEMKLNKKYSITTLKVMCIQDNIIIEIDLTNEDLKDKEFVKSVLRANHRQRKIIERKNTGEIKIGDII